MVLQGSANLWAENVETYFAQNSVINYAKRVACKGNTSIKVKGWILLVTAMWYPVYVLTFQISMFFVGDQLVSLQSYYA